MVIATVPDVREALDALAGNFRWVWDRPTQEVFEALGSPAWQERRNATEVVQSVTPERLVELAADPSFVDRLSTAAAGLADYLADESPTPTVAYFCMEHGIAPALRTYAGGLGMLAGCIEKTASDRHVPMVAVGLRYAWRMRQRLSYGWQNEEWEPTDPAGTGLELCPDLGVTVELAGETVALRVWRAAVGRVDLYLLDTDVDANPPHLRTVTDRLYGGDAEHRLRQEMVLGVGGARTLAALGLRPTVFHANEGHAGFVGLERLLGLVRSGSTVDEAVQVVRQSTIFTTHTAVPAGFDLFDRTLVEKYLGDWCIDAGVSTDWLMALGHFPDQQPDEPFNMAVLCSRLSGYVNAVSRLHREITEQRVLGRLWPGHAAPIDAVTNGVHPGTWTPPAMAALFDKYAGPGWEYAGSEQWQDIYNVPADELWRTREELRAGLVRYVRSYLPAQLRAQGWGDDLSWTQRVLDPHALTVVVARRAAEYKETDLLVSFPDRLRALLLNPSRPVNLIVAGQAHPKDGGGKARIKHIVDFSLQPDLRANVVFLPGYDMLVALHLLAGADVWLNHPRRGDEACGTSFMKSVYAGGRILTTADGGADELIVHGHNGWIIGDRTFGASREAIADSAFRLLEQEIVPEFYDRDADGVPVRWADGIKMSLASLGWRVSSARMMEGYERVYRDTTRA